jgi:ERCC4-type nuclease|tara:strand:- start:358 stop:825 length:468 start_codon:yes stop_codon:yes gene_type:complete
MADYSDFNIIIDTREQQAWEFPRHSTANKKLDTGDYSLGGLEDILCIERKKSVSEIASNITEKRFEDVLERMTKYKYTYMIFEFSLTDVLMYPQGSEIPRHKWKYIRISPNFILKKLSEYMVNYNIKIIFGDSPKNAEKIAMALMRRVYEIEREE